MSVDEIFVGLETLLALIRYLIRAVLLIENVVF